MQQIVVGVVTLAAPATGDGVHVAAVAAGTHL
jgi:hypothetical protein